MSAAPVLYAPSADAVRATQLDAFRREIEARYGLSLPDSRALHAWSVTHIADFWRELFDQLGVRGERGARDAVDLDAMPGAHGKR